MEASEPLTNTMFATQILPPCGLFESAAVNAERSMRKTRKIEMYIGAAFI